MKKTFITLCVSLIFQSAWALRPAMVVNNKSVVFSDMTLQSPIGYIRKGKVITVGEKVRKNGTLATLIIGGKLAYIEVKNLSFKLFHLNNSAKRVATREYLDESIDQGEDFSKRNSLIFDIHVYDMGNQWEDFSRIAGDADVDSLKSYKILYFHRFNNPHLAIAAGFGYYFVSQKNMGMRAISAEFQLYGSPIINSIFSIDLFAGASISGTLSLAVKGVDQDIDGSFLAYQGGAQFTLFPYSKLNAHAGASFKRMAIEGIDSVNFAGSGVTAKLNVLRGIDLYLGASYSF